MAKPIAAVTLYTLRDFCKTLPDITTTLGRIKDMGYKAFQISGIGAVDAKELGKVVADTGMTCCITHMGWGRFQDDLDGVIEDHHAWGCKHTAIGGLPGEYFCEGGVKRFLDELAPIAEKLAAAGLDFSYHNHSHELVKHGGQTWLGELYSTASKDLLKGEIDTYWIQHGGGDPTQWITDNAGRIPVLHFKDMQITPEREQRFAAVGEGNLNWPAIIDAAETGGCEYAVCEQDNCWGEDPFACVETSYRNMKAMGLQ